MKLQKIVLSLFIAVSTLLAIDPVTSLSVSAPHNSGTNTNDDSIEFTWTPPANVARYYYKLDENSTNYDLVSAGGYTTHNSTGSTLTVTAPASGDYYLHIVAVESGGGTSTPEIVQVTSTIDLDKGTVTATEGGSFTGSKSVTLTGSETGRLFYTVDGSDINTSDTSNSGSTKSVLDNSVSPTATFTLAVTATVQTKLVDTAGNVGDESNTTYTITNNPTIKTAADAVIDGQTVATSDAAGATPIAALDVAGTDFTRYQYAIDSDAGHTPVGDMDTNIDISSLDTGSHTVYVRGGDAFNFQQESTSVTFTVDNTAPSGLKISVGGVDVNESNASTYTFADNFTFTLSASDGTIRYSTDGSTTPSKTAGTQYSSAVTTSKTVTDGTTSTFPIKFTSYDSAGNVATVESIDFTIDKQDPTITLPSNTEAFSGPEDKSISTDDNSSTIYYLVSDSASTTIESLKNNGQSGSGSGVTATIGKNPTSNAEDSTYKYLHVIAVDIVGNGDDSGDIETVEFTYSGNQIKLSADSSLDIGNVVNGETNTSSITITNSGTESVTIYDDNITVVGNEFNVTSSTGDNGKTIAADGTYNITVSFSPTSTGVKSGTLSIVYGGTSDLNISLSGTGVNSAPSATYTSDINTSEDNAVNVTLTGTDPENDDLMFYVGSSDVNGTISLETNGSLTYTPGADFNGTGWFTYYVNDSDKNSSEQNITINVSGVNDLPVITLSSDSIQANGGDGDQGSITWSATDIENDTVTGTVTVNPTKGSADVNATHISFDGNGAGKGSDSFTVVFSDGNDGNVTKVISVAMANNVPVITISDITTDEDTNKSNVVVGVTDEDDVTVSLESAASSGTVTIHDTNVTSSDNNQTTYTYEPNANVNGSDSFTLKFDDGFGGVVTKVVNVTINSVNDTPQIDTTLADLSVNEDFGVSNVDLNISDVEGSDLNLTVESNNTSLVTVATNWNGSLRQGDYNGVALDFNVSSVANAYGMAKITVMVNDGDKNSTQTFDINVSSQNDAPVFSVSNRTKNEDFADFNITLQATDVDDTNLTYALGDFNDSLVSISLSGNTLTVSSVSNASGVTTVEVNATDGEATTSEEFNITVNSVNDLPTIQTISDINKSEDADQFVVTVNGYDEESNNSLEYNATSSDTDLATVTINANQVTVTPVANATGTVTITVSVSDGLNTVQETFDISLIAVNDAPTIESTFSAISLATSGVENLDLNVSDIDGDDLNVTVESNNTDLITVSQNWNGLVLQANYDSLDFNLTADANTSGTAKITIMVHDDELNVSTTFDVNVTKIDLGTDISADTNVSVGDTNLTFVDNNGTIDLTVKVGSKERTVSNEAGITPKRFDNGNSQYKGTVQGSEVDVTISANGDVSSKVTNDSNVSSELNTDIDEKVDSKIKTNGTVETSFTKTFDGNAKVIKIEIASDGTVKPTIEGAVLPQTDLPAGTTTTVDNTKIQFNFALDSKLEF